MKTTRLICLLSSASISAIAFASSSLAAGEPIELTHAPGGFSTLIRGTETMSYDTNPLRLPTGEETLFGSTTSPQLILLNKTPTMMIEADTRIDANYFNHSEYDSTDVHEKLYLAKSNERWTTSLRGLYDYDTTRTSELTNYALNLPKVRSTRLGATPYVEFRPNASDTYGLSASVFTASYDNNAFTDYNVYSLSPSYKHAFDPKNTGTFSLRAQRYETQSGNDLQSDSIGPSIGWISLLTPRLTATVSAGAEKTDQSGNGAGNEKSTWNYVFLGNLAFKGKQDQTDFTASRAQEPFGNGTQTLLTSFSVTERHRLNDALSLKGMVGYQYADYDTTPGVNLDSGLSAGTGISYRALPNLDLNADYRYRNETLTNISGDVNEHVFMLGITLHAPTDVIDPI